jgi:hypothetical protein
MHLFLPFYFPSSQDDGIFSDDTSDMSLSEAEEAVEAVETVVERKTVDDGVGEGERSDEDFTSDISPSDSELDESMLGTETATDTGEGAGKAVAPNFGSGVSPVSSVSPVSLANITTECNMEAAEVAAAAAVAAFWAEEAAEAAGAAKTKEAKEAKEANEAARVEAEATATAMEEQKIEREGKVQSVILLASVALVEAVAPVRRELAKAGLTSIQIAVAGKGV